MASSVMETLERVQKHKGVLGLLVVGEEGQVHKSTFDEALTADYADMIPGLTALARSMVRELDPLNDLEFLRIRSAKHEIMVAPRDEFVLIVVQDPSVGQ
ncbi:MAG: putative bithoraxoid-like protein [Monoraphidium minutum]|nr:MAG: putative bithoraxoid-like protein [Monoraphidium minutum]